MESRKTQKHYQYERLAFNKLYLIYKNRMTFCISASTSQMTAIIITYWEEELSGISICLPSIMAKLDHKATFAS
jgi:hypothetical protein